MHARDATLDRYGFAAALDRTIHAVAFEEPQLRASLGRLGGELVRRRLYQELGFVRLGDYCRERLGMSARELESIVQVASRLKDLPRIAAAHAAGELSWTQTRLISPLVSAETEMVWLDAAMGRSVRDLESLIRSHPDARTPSAREALAECAESGPPIDGEPATAFRIHCPAAVRVRWRHAVELARRMAGEPLPVWGAADVIAAEASSGPRTLRNVRDAHSARDRRDAEGDRAAHTPPHAACGAQRQRCRDVVGEAPADERASPRTIARDARPHAAGEVAAAGDAELARSASRDDAGHVRLDAFELDARLRSTVAALLAIDARLGELLRQMLDQRWYRVLGFSSRAHYVRERVGISLRKAQALLAIERACIRSRAFAEAYRRGELAWTRALAIVPVVRVQGGDRWIEHANAVTLRRLHDDVDAALNRHDALAAERAARVDAREAGLVVGEARCDSIVQLRARQMQLASVSCDADVRFTGPASVVALFRAMLDAYHEAEFPRWTALDRMLRHVIAEWERMPRHRDPIFARDGWRCTVPACSARRSLQDHHLRWRSRGGGNAQSNRTAVCASHHIHAVHLNRIRASGTAPAAILWELGVRRTGPPLLTLIGDRYVDGSPSCSKATTVR